MSRILLFSYLLAEIDLIPWFTTFIFSFGLGIEVSMNRQLEIINALRDKYISKRVVLSVFKLQVLYTCTSVNVVEYGIGTSECILLFHSVRHHDWCRRVATAAAGALEQAWRDGEL